MRVIFFYENLYAIDSFAWPIHKEALYLLVITLTLLCVHVSENCQFPLKDEVNYNFYSGCLCLSPDVIFVPGNIVLYLPGVKIQIFHGYAAEKKIIG